MKLSTRSTYGVRAVLALALEYGRSPVMVKEIAKRHNLPATYLEQLMTQLRKAGFVSATRGAHGGYSLSRPPADITIAELVEALEGPLDLAEPLPDDANTPSALDDLWAEASQALVGVLQQVTLAKLVERQREKESSFVLMYTI